MPASCLAPLTAVCALLATAVAQTVGTTAPELVFDHRHHFGAIEAKRLGELRGSVVLVEFWGSHCEFCRGEVPHLNRLHQDKLDAGLVVIGITPEPPAVVEPYLTRHGVRFPIAIGDVRAYALESVPDAILVDKNGTILWRGRPYHLDDATIDRALVGARPPFVPAGLEDVHDLRRRRAHGLAFARLQSLLSGDTLDDTARQRSKEWLDAYQRAVADALAAADAATDDPYAAWTALQPIAEWHRGVPGADQAAQRLARLLADTTSRREIDAGRKWAEVALREQAFEFDAADALCKEVVQRFGSTRVGKLAAARRKDYVQQGKLGFDPTCAACRDGAVACRQHRRKSK